MDYRVATSVEPASADNVTSDDSPLRRPGGVPSPASTTEAPRGPLLPWGEEFNLTREVAEKSYTTILPIAEAKSLPPGTTLARGLRIELTAYEGSTQVDSTALDVQLLDDPSEQQNLIDARSRSAAADRGLVGRKGPERRGRAVGHARPDPHRDRASRDQESAGLEPLVAPAAVDPPAHHRMDLAPPPRPRLNRKVIS